MLLAHTTGIAYFDGIASVIIGLILGGTAVWLAHETKGLLIGESANQRVVDGIRDIVIDNPRVRHVNEVLTMHMGPDFILLNISIDFQGDLPATELEETIVFLEQKIKEAYPNVKRVFMEAEARQPNSVTV